MLRCLDIRRPTQYRLTQVSWGHVACVVQSKSSLMWTEKYYTSLFLILKLLELKAERVIEIKRRVVGVIPFKFLTLSKTEIVY